MNSIKLNRRYGCSSLLVFILLFGSSPLASGAILNGGFESGNLSNWTFSGNVGVTDGVGLLCCAPSEGTYFAAFNGGNSTPDGSISQTFATTAGIEYLIAFDFGKGGVAPGTAALQAVVQGQGGFTRSLDVFDSTGAQPGLYDRYLLSYLADSTSATITFLDRSNATNNFDTLLDNITINPVPIPAAAWLFGTALIGLIGLGKRRQSA